MVSWLVWFCDISTIVDYLIPNPLHTYTINIHDLIWLSNGKSSLYIYIEYIWFGLVWFYDISTIVGYSMPNHLYAYILNVYVILFGLIRFYGISTIVGCLMPNPLYTYISNIYDLVLFGFVTYQPL